MATSSADEKAKFSARDSLACKYSAWKLKYFDDPYVESVYAALNDSSGVAPVRRSPIIHRGYYTRFECFTKIIDGFLSGMEGIAKQVVFLGAGFDTLPLLAHRVSKAKAGNLKTFEVDFPDVISKKASVFQSIPAVVELLSTQEPLSMISPRFTRIGSHTFIGEDLRNSGGTVHALLECGLDGSLPTLILSECVLVYMNKASTMGLCESLGAVLQSEALWVTYDMITPTDIYGRNMVRNLQAAGFEIPGIKDFPTLEDQKNRFLLTGWKAARSRTMRFYYDKILDTELRDRLFKLEMLDEVEEWNMLMEHYSLTIASKQELVVAEAEGEGEEQGRSLAQLLEIIP